MAQDSLELLLWAKRQAENDGSSEYHPLVCHLIDVATVCRALWTDSLSVSLRAWLAGQIGLDEEAACRWIAFWAGAHDIGKACPAFQQKWPAAKTRLGEAGFRFHALADARHGTVGAAVLPELFRQQGTDRDSSGRLATAVAGHHGVFPTTREVLDAGTAIGGQEWGRARRAMIDHLAKIAEIGGQSVPTLPAQEAGHAVLMVLAGLTSVADWIGSQELHFPYAGGEVNVKDYAEQSWKQANDALRALGWSGWNASPQPLTFGELFPSIRDSVRPLQREAVRLAAEVVPPALVLIESPMGEGKTEAAMYLADHFGAAYGQRGCYFALPTQATSNQMFGRVCRFLEHRYPNVPVNVQLLHGHAALSAEFELLVRRGAVPDVRGIYDESAGGTDEGGVRAAEWFTHRKRGLLAPFGVGTVDQILLAVLQTRHVFVRLFGLAHKTVIIDEVHAYDAYMSTLLERLLEWLAAMGTSVVLLSATLPRAKRESLLRAYGGANAATTRDETTYPRITTVAGGRCVQTHAPASPRPPICLSWHAGDGANLGEELAAALKGGGCAAVVCNTVGRAQELYTMLKRSFRPGDELDLLHARYPFGERDSRERRVLARFGKSSEGQRPFRAVLVATQVIEQSLDLDFDLMVTELAPVDLVLQRAGRLHRHSRNERPIRDRHLWITEPPTAADGTPNFGNSERVYQRYLLLRSYLRLHATSTIRVPDDVEDMIEDVYAALPLPAATDAPFKAALERSGQALLEEEGKNRHVARNYLIKPPAWADDILEDFCQQLEEDNPDIHPALQAMTRLSEPTVQLICLHKVAGRLCLDPDASESVDLEQQPEPGQVRKLLCNALTLSHPGCVRHFAAQDCPRGWHRSGLLRHYRVVELDDKGGSPAGNYNLRLDPELGIVITRCNQKER
jgi:CRISPR-associated endonuclease/helicase Cas3